MKNTTKKKRIVYLDTLRALAIISVIAFHVYCRAGQIVFHDFATIPSLNWFIAVILGPCSRYGVDIFLMLSGALSLGRQWDIKTFLSKRISRIVLPYLFWCITLSLFLILVTKFAPNIMPLAASYRLPLDIVQYDSLPVFADFIINKVIFANTPWFTQNWFFWMILGTYLIMPIFNKWLYNANLKEAEYFLVIWLISCIFDYTLFIEFPIKITYFSGPIGMVVLGYYLRHTERKIFNELKYSIIILLIGIFSTILASYMMSDNSHIFAFHRYSIFMAITAVGIFTLFKNIEKENIDFFNSPNSIFRKITFSIAKYSYGIYLNHMVFLNLIFLLSSTIFYFKGVAAITLFGTIIICWLILAILNRIPYINQIIGAK